LQLINDVLDLAKIESGMMTLSLEPVLASRVIAEALTLVQPQADAKGIHLYANLNDLEKQYVMADNVRYKQALINLLSNAVKYNNIGGEVEVRLGMSEQQHLRLYVRDNGKGIPENRQAEVFQPFNRLNAENSNTEGTGVGLVITKKLVEMMSGTLNFTSTQGVGTEFWIETSCVEVSYTPVKMTEIDYTPATLTLQASKQILYIEDNPTNIRLMEQFFAHHMMLHLDVADEPFLGIYKARSQRPDIIILDINLPGMDGYDVMRILKQDPATAHIPIIGLSANAMPYDIERSIQAGFDEYITKPVNINTLTHTLNRLLRA
jgi:CheY-like chemotaxis protein/anti-sigma regulatory factor (Ser/Thr protein kinase)